MKQVIDVAAGILDNDVEQFDEVTDNLTGSDIVVGSYPAILYLNECGKVLLGYSALIAIERSMNVGEFLGQHKHFLGSQWLETEHRTKHVLMTFL